MDKSTLPCNKQKLPTQITQKIIKLFFNTFYISFNYTQKFPMRTKFRNAHSKLRHSTVKYFFEINKGMAEIDFICKLKMMNFF